MPKSSEAAAELTKQLGKNMTSTNARVTLHRARERFAELLLSEVVRSLEDGADDREIDEELKALNMHKVCASAVEKRRRDKCKKPQ